MFERMDIAEQVYKGGNISKTSNKAEAERASHSRKLKGVESASPTKPENFHAVKRNKIMQAIRAMIQTVQRRHDWCMASDTLRQSARNSPKKCRAAAPPGSPVRRKQKAW